MRKLLLLFLVLFSVFNQLNAQVAIGSGTLETENAPFEPYYGYSYSQTVYLASEINASGTITDIQWYYSGATAMPNSQELVIYMAESPKSEFDSNTDWEPIDSFTEVYSGGITVTAGSPGWVQITLDTPFDYANTDNLIIAVEENMPAYDNFADDFYNTEVGTNRTIYHYSDSVNADPASPPSANSIDTTIPNIILGGIEQLCPNPYSAEVDVNLTTADFTWEGGSATAWEVINQEVGGTAPTDTDSGTSVDASTYQATDLTLGADYEFYVRADCGADGYSGWVGPLTYHISDEGEACSNPINVTTLPYTTADNTSEYLDDYAGSPGADCSTTSSYLNGDDVVYAYTPTEDTSIDLELSDITENYAGMFVYTDCDDIGTGCVGGASNGFSTDDLVIDNFTVTAGTTYYIVISTWFAQSVGYTLDITENTCIDQEITYSVVSDCVNGPQFFIEADVTSLGSATTLTLTDDQGSAEQTVTDIGIYTFGPYDNATDVIITSENVDDANCILESEVLTQPFCSDNVVDCAVGPVNTTFCYGPSNDVTFTYTSSDGSALTLIVNGGFVENGWDYFIVYDSDGTTELTDPDTTGDLSGVFQSTGDTISFTVDADTVGSCSTSAFYEEIDVTVSCATCTNPEWSYEVVGDCINGPQFNIEVDLSDMGTGTSYTISDDQGGDSQTVTELGIYTFGPYDNTTQVALTIANDDDVNCELTGPAVTQEFCTENYVNCDEGPLNSVFCYGPNNDTTMTFTSNDGTSLIFIVNAGFVENGWDYFHVYDTDGTELTPVDGLTGDLAGNVYQSSGDTISYFVDADGGGSCTDTWTTYDSIDVTVICATCDLPTWSYAPVSDCINGPQFNVEVDLSDMGSATSYTITDNQGGVAQTATETGIYTFGPYANETEVSFTIANDDDANCTLSGQPVTQPFCLDNYIDCPDGEPINFVYCYGNDDTNIFTFTSSDGTPLNFDVNAGDLSPFGGDYFHVYDTDGTELTPNEFMGFDEDGDLTGVSFQSTGDTISFWIESNAFTSCQDTWTSYASLDVTVACATCINPQASYTIVDDCENGEQFLVDVEITNMGSGSSLTISSDYDDVTVTATEAGTYQMGPFAFNTAVEIAVVNDDDVTCDIYSPEFLVLACPPENDNPCDAIAVEVNEVDECTLFTSGTVAGGTPSTVAAPTCNGQPNDDVWFTFEANTEAQVVSLNNIANGNLNLDFSVYEGTCDGTLTELYCSDASVGAVEGLTVGETYYVRVYSFDDEAVGTTFDICIKPSPGNIVTDQVTYTVEQLVTDVLIANECAQISNITYSTGTDFDSVNGIAYFYTESPGFPFDDGIMLASGDAALADGPNDGTASSGGFSWPGDTDLDGIVGGNTNNASIIEFDFVPFADEISFDFIMASEEYNGGSFECNYSDAFAFLLTDELGVTTNLAVLPGTTTPILVTNIHPENTSCGAINEEYFGGYTPDNLPPMIYDGRTVQFTAFSNVNIGETYHIKLVMADEGDSALDSAVFLKAGSFDIGDFDLGIDITIESGNAICDGEPIILDTGAPSVEHVWYKDGFIVEGATESTLEISEEGEYTAQVIFSPTCNVDDTILVEYLPNPAIGEPMDLEVCSTTPFGVYDLTENTPVVLGDLDPALFTVSYHLTEQDAIDDVNPLVSPYANVTAPQTIWVRVFDTVLGCKTVSSFDLIITAPTHTATSVDLLECDNDGDGVAEYDLDAHSTYILDGQDAAAYNVTYYASEQDAMDAANPLANPYTSAGNETVWVRVETVGLPDCYVTNSFMLTIGTAPMTSFTEDFDYIVCEGTDVPVIIEATPGNYTEDEVSINWYQDEVLIEGEHGLTLPVLTGGIYEVEVIFNDTGCSAITEQVMETVVCEFPQGISPNGDGLNDNFDLSVFRVSKIEIFNRLGTLVYSKRNYTNEWYGQTNDGDELPVGTYFYTLEYNDGETRSAWVYINK